MIWYRFVPPATVVLLPLFILLALAASFGAGLWIAALMVEYRDFRFIVPFVVQFGLYGLAGGAHDQQCARNSGGCCIP